MSGKMDALICSQCGYPLSYDEKRKVYFCEACDSEYIKGDVIINNITNNYEIERKVPIEPSTSHNKNMTNTVLMVLRILMYCSYLLLLIYSISKFNYIMTFGRGTPETAVINVERITTVLLVLSAVCIFFHIISYSAYFLSYVITGGLFGFYLLFFASVLRSGTYCERSIVAFLVVAIISTVAGILLARKIGR